MRYDRLSPLLAGFCLALLGQTAHAQDYRLPPEAGEKKGVEVTDWLRIKPYARFGAYWTSNLFQEPSRRNEGDTVFQMTGGSDVVLGDEAGSFFDVGYAATQLMYVKNPKENTVEHRTRYNTHVDLNKSVSFDSYGSGTWAAANTDPQFSGRVRNFSGFGRAELNFKPTDTFGLRLDGDMAYTENFPTEFERANSLTSRVGTFVVLNPNLPWGLEFEVGSNWRQIHYVDVRATNPDFELVSWQAGARVTNDVVDLRARAGYEIAYVKKRNRFPRHHRNPKVLGDTTPEGFYGDGSLTIRPNQSTTFSLFGLHRLKFTQAAFFQRATHVGTSVKQLIPVVEGLYAFAGMDWDLQQPRHQRQQRTLSYKAGVGWAPVEYLEIGAQGSYLRSRSRAGGYEVWEFGLQLTLSI